MSPLQRASLLLAGSLALAFGVYGFVAELAMLGWDGWPLAAAGRFASAGELVAGLGEELMDGRYPYGRFYRPLTQLTFGLDHAHSGLDPAGYHRTDLGIFALTTTCVGLLVARLFPRGGLLAGAFAALFFALHPVQLELVPVPPRRADHLALALVCATLLALPRGARPGIGRSVLLLFLAAAAPAAKETGVIVAPLALAACLWAWPSGGDGRVRSALTRCAPVLAGCALVLVLRTLVLSGLGGHRGTASDPDGVLGRWTDLVVGALHPRPVPFALPTGLVVVASLGIVGAAAAAARRDGGATRGGLAVAATWTVCVLALTALAERSHAWYALLLVVPLAALAGAAFATGCEGLRGERRGGPILWCASTLALLASVAVSSPLLRAPHHLREASALARSTEAGLEDALGPEPEPGSVTVLGGWVPILGREGGPLGAGAVHVAAPYTLAAWCELRWPGLTFEVTELRGDTQPAPGRVRVLLRP